MSSTMVPAPQFGVNDNSAKVVAWHVGPGDEVEPGQVLCELETAKATFEVEATAAGLVLPLVDLGVDVVVGQPLALVGADLAALTAEREALAEPAGDAVARATDKARRLAESLSVDLAEMPAAGGIIRERDVRAFAERHAADPFEIEPIDGELEPALRRAIVDDPDFPDLPSDEKIERYRAAGAKIGAGVQLGQGVLIDAAAIEFLDEVEIYAGTTIRAETVRIGRMSVIGADCSITCRHIRIGAVLYTASRVTVGGADQMSPTDKLIIGDQCLISARCFLDSGNGIRIGNQVGISPFVKLYTHQHWQNVLEGYRSSFGPIVIEDGAYITGDCLVTPNIRIGAGSTVLANSTVAANVEPYTVVSGNPARKVADVERLVDPERKERIAKRLLSDMQAALADRLPGGSVVYCRRFEPSVVGTASVVLTFDPGGVDPGDDDGLVLFDLTAYRVLGRQTPDSDEVRNFLRRRGVRFTPIHWRYRG